MGQATEQLKNVDLQTATTRESNTKDLVRYGIQLAMLNTLLSRKLITEKEYYKVNEQLRSDYEIASAA